MAIESKAEMPGPGSMIPSFELAAANRPGHLNPWNYKQHDNLLLFFFHGGGCAACRRLLRDIAAKHSEYRNLDCEVLAISREGIEELRQLAADLNLPFPLLSDREGRVFEAYLGQGARGLKPREGDVAVFIADRFGELYARMIAADADGLPAEPGIRDWFQFIQIQCPECYAPEWPA
ncbi:MAG TPA: redoxin domain-containing protein [Blastocatellia bacterium]|nr:redoxin domain-containing protein [Blastocatellia bacterium]